MLNTLRSIATSLFFAGAMVGAHAVCEEHVQKGLTSLDYGNQSSFVRQYVDSYLASSTYEKARDKFGATFAVDGVPVTANAENFRSYQKAIQQSNVSDTVARYESEVMRSFGDQNLVTAYLGCLALNGGVFTRFVALDDPLLARLEVTYFASAGDPREVKVDTATPFSALLGVAPLDDVTCASKGGRLQDRVACQVNIRLDSATRAVPFSIATAKGGNSAFLPPRMELRKGQEPLPRKYLTGQNLQVQSHYIVAPVGDIVDGGEICTAPLPDGRFVIVTPTNPKAVLSSRQGSPQNNGSAKVTTFPGIARQVCFWGQCGHSSGSRAECDVVLAGDMEFREWVPRRGPVQGAK